ncbi:MAG TPA: tRNA (adenosine(37)-N6)-threonylcarbamoyltransferase complex dimerization subunit type 1 TsaB [Vicinamibacteria bacterium]|nr:tRNA (adenosine(37)-N6)-threonylcarbamoyltransferase complex dimerization subunit type 1 TsaB [Vicinamibacteria bacterium]
MLILAVDTSTERESVAVVESGSVRAELRLRAVDTHSRRLLPAAAFLLESLGLAPGAVQGYAVTAGPGAFTGLRVGIATVQGLALASGRPCLAMSALDVMAARIVEEAPVLAVMGEAYRGEVFGALYDAGAHPVSPPAVEPPEAFLARVPDGPVAFIGEGARRHRSLVLERRPQARFPRRSLFLAGTLGLLAEPRLEAGEGVPPEALRPHYLREAHIRPPGP